ncbi:MAG: hypothetical protein A2Y14_04645 [Verrucomicrobia bacterium GWF2_51_19]|nr:MAG: hypothetical protein A2Y14_04645 [Verrucomicrobia bacterium GWF2_51_19]HCJ12305.1 hypothetical protein [Opitutae bacterium]
MTVETTIPIQGVCAWPVLVDTGAEVFCILHNAPTHGESEADLECWASADFGKNWEKRGIAAPHEPGANRMHIAAGLYNGEWIVVSSGVSVDEKKALQPMWCSRSSDGGRTWAVDKHLDLPKRLPALIPFGRVLSNNKGHLFCTGYRAFSRQEPSRTYFLRSKDGGHKWSKRSELGKGDSNECALIRTHECYLAATRTHFDHHIHLYRSRWGRYWRNLGPLTLSMQHPADLTRIDDSRVLLTYAIRNRGCFAIAYRIGSSDGARWSAPVVLKILSAGNALDCGYPSTLIRNNTCLTAYYSSPNPPINDYHLGLIHWQMPG